MQIVNRYVMGSGIERYNFSRKHIYKATQLHKTKGMETPIYVPRHKSNITMIAQKFKKHLS